MNTVFLSHKWGPSCPSYGGGPRIEIQKTRCMNVGDSCNSLSFTANNHMGTHFDFPYHFNPLGACLDDYTSDQFFFEKPALFWLENTGNLVSVEVLMAALNSGWAEESDLILIRTGASLYRTERRFWEHGPGIDTGVAGFIRKRFPKSRCIGIDAISVSSWQNRSLGRVVHQELLCDPDHPFLLIEDLNLEPLKCRTPQRVIALPLRIEGADGAPCSVVADMG